ncbi:MAG: alanine racemase [Cyclobacteriaceae bacterium]
MKIKQPTLFVNETIVRQNIRAMKAKADHSNALFRPHFKTHHSADIGEWFRQEGVNQITCSSVSMAAYFADCGWENITIAFPYNPLEFEEINRLASEIVLNIIVESTASLEHAVQNIPSALNIFIKIDLGTHRTGVEASQVEVLAELFNFNYRQHQLIGLLGHAGHSYTSIDKESAQVIFENSRQVLCDIRKMSKRDLIISYGDTPTCSLLDQFSDIDELRPGNLAFYDMMQHSFGVCRLSDVAVCMVCPVVAIHPTRNEAVIYGGAVHFSKDHIIIDQEKYFGAVVPLHEDGWAPNPIAKVVRLSQEHGIISGSNAYISSLKVGNLVVILPIHSCLTADLQGYYLTLDGKLLRKQNRNPIHL